MLAQYMVRHLCEEKLGEVFCPVEHDLAAALRLGVASEMLRAPRGHLGERGLRDEPERARAEDVEIRLGGGCDGLVFCGGEVLQARGEDVDVVWRRVLRCGAPQVGFGLVEDTCV